MPRSNEGPNWLFLAGGAAVTALSYVIGRRQKQAFEGRVEEWAEKSGKAQLANHKDSAAHDYRGSKVTEASLHHELNDSKSMKVLDDTSLSVYEDGHQASKLLDGQRTQDTLQGGSDLEGAQPNNGSGCLTPSSPLTELSEEETRTHPATQEDVQPSSDQGMHAGRTSKRDMVHRLRKQLKSRDEMILNMQAQISEHERVMSVSHPQVSELQSRLDATNKLLLDSDQEVQHLQRVVADRDATVAKEMNAILMEVGGLKGEVDRLEREKSARETHWQSLSEEHKSKVRLLELDLENQKMLVIEKENLLDLTKQELSTSTAGLHDLQHKLEVQAQELEALRHNKARLEAYTRDPKSKGVLSRTFDLHSSQEIIHPTSTETLDCILPRKLDASNSPENYSKGDFEGSESSEVVHPFNLEKTTMEDDSVGLSVSDSMVAALEQEVEQLSTALATQSKVVFEQKEETTKLVENLQQTGSTDEEMQSTLDSAHDTLKPEDPKWVHQSQQLPFSMSAASVAEVNELSNKLDEVAKQRKVEEEMAELSKHQAKIAELQQRIARLTRVSADEVRNEQTLRAATLILGLAEKLAAQEEQAKHTALEVQRLSTSFQLLSPIVAKYKKEESQMLLKEEPYSGQEHPHTNGHVKYCIPSTLPRYASQDRKANKIVNSLLDPQASISSLDNARPSADHDQLQYSAPTELVESYQFEYGASGPPASKVRRLSSKREGKSSQRKKPLIHMYSTGHGTDTLTPDKRIAGPDTGTKSYIQEQLDTDGSQDEAFSSKSATVSEGTEIANDHCPGEEMDRHSSYETEKLMAATTPEEGKRFLPTYEEYSPPVQLRSPQEGTGSSRRYLFNSDADHVDDSNDLEASTGHSATGMESAPEEESTSGSSFLMPRSESASLSPFSKMMVRLDLKEGLPSSSLQEASHEFLVSEVSNDVSRGEMTVPVDVKNLKLSVSMERDVINESGSESEGSIDSEFNDILDGTLDDLVKVCSTLVTPADTPTSSVLSQGSDARNVRYF